MAIGQGAATNKHESPRMRRNTLRLQPCPICVHSWPKYLASFPSLDENSERDSAGDLNISWRRHRPFVPLSEGAAVDVGVESGQCVIVPEVERLRAELEIHALGNANVLGEREIMIPVAESAIVRNARAASKIGPRPESPTRLECSDVDKRLARIEIALILRPRNTPTAARLLALSIPRWTTISLPLKNRSNKSLLFLFSVACSYQLDPSMLCRS